MSNIPFSLKSRHIQFIALGGTIGTGLFLGIGSAFATSGPLSVLLGYSFTGLAIYGMMMCLGEMCTYLPLPGAIPQYCARYVDPAMGFAVGWNNWYASSIILCVEISAAAVVIQFWNEEINIAAWISIIIVIIIFLNIFAVSIYGEAEFIFASIKIITIVGLLILALILDLGGGPSRDRLGFRYWKNPGAMKEYIDTGDSGRFLGLFKTLINAAFSYGGVEMVAVAAGEAADPKRNIPKAVRRVFWRILFFYVLGSLAIGVLVPSNEEKLLKGGAGAARSPWVIAIYRAGIPALPSIINAVILTSATSSGNAFLYTGSRYLFAVAQNGHAPKFLLKCSKRGVPYYCVGITSSVSLLTYLCVSAGANNVFIWLANITTIAQLLTWCSICIAYLRFKKALEVQGVSRDSLVYKTPFQPYTAWFALIFFSMIIIFNGFAVFTKGRWLIDDFLTAYIGLPIYFCLYLLYRVWKRSSFVKSSEADIWTGKAALDAEVWPERIPRNWLERFWFWLA
ncbi:amino-acid permease inda1 [Patellaria atrata CBS 101060]|uniref:Amino-acid permease inda1 n=1 Tax=Patellaria atrata CBS 101060 TaxID=1346257 RepID=A0A9P4S9A2_9PEZI|nr:amino-acid permease inda1 [Patellaria atrata CBS 101060]